MNKLTWITACAALTLGYFGFSQPAMAQYYSQGESKYSIVVDKTISDIKDQNYYDNIASNKKIFREKDQIDFRIVVENTGNTSLQNIKLTDTLPKYLQVINSFGSQKDNRVETTIDNLEVGQTKTYNIRATIANTPAESYADQKWQLTNRVCVSNDKANDCDNASYFVGGKVIPVTGNETLILQTLIMGLTGISALGLKRLIRGY